MTNTELIKEFYKAFADGDTAKMKACYTEDILFEDPLFGRLQGKQVGYMWQMLFEKRQGSLDITFDKIKITADETTGTASWQAIYNYGGKKRKVINNVTAKFEFKNGKISKHTDDFDFWKWTQQALGPLGYLLGWSSFVKSQVRTRTNSMLYQYIQKQ